MRLDRKVDDTLSIIEQNVRMCFKLAVQVSSDEGS